MKFPGLYLKRRFIVSCLLTSSLFMSLTLRVNSFGLSLSHLVILRVDPRLSAPPRRRSNASRGKCMGNVVSVSQPTSANSTTLPVLSYSVDRKIGKMGSESSTKRNIEFSTNASISNCVPINEIVTC